MSSTVPQRPPAEELANGLTHGLGAGLAVAGLVLLAVFAARHGSARHVVSCVIYGSTLVLLFAASGSYHLARAPRAKAVLQVVDHSSIFLLIAGTYTPYTLVVLRGPWGWTLFGLVWGLALAGLLAELFMRRHLRLVSVPLYLAMGWLALPALRPLLHNLSTGGLVWLVLGGVLYTLGVVFYALKRVPFAHTVSHLFVLAGSICHFFGVLFHVIPPG